MPADTKAPRRPGRPARDDVRQSVLAAVDQLLRVHGLEPLTVADLLEVADVSRTTFYKHFSGRDDAVAELYLDYIRSAEASMITSIIGSADLGDFAQRATRAFLLFMLKWSSANHTQEFDKLRFSNEKMRRARELIVDRFQMATNILQEQNGEPPIPRYITAAAISAIETLGTSVCAQRNDQEDEADEAVVERVMALISRAFLGLLPPTNE